MHSLSLSERKLCSFEMIEDIEAKECMGISINL